MRYAQQLIDTSKNMYSDTYLTYLCLTYFPPSQYEDKDAA